MDNTTGLFRLPTEEEDQATLADQMQAELVNRKGLILNDFANERRASLELVLDAARSIEADGGHRLMQDSSVGWMLVKE